MATQETAEAVVTEASGAAPTFEQEVNEIVSKMTQDEKGNYQLPEGQFTEAARYAANAERRRRTTESTLSKTRLQLKAQETVADKLKERIVERLRPQVSKAELAALEELKYADPEEWRRQVNTLEQQATTTLQTELGTISSEASQQAELGARLDLLAEFNKTAQIPLTDDVVKFDVPPRISKKLEEGKISFEEFLHEAHDYLVSPKRVGGTDVTGITNLGAVGGGAQPSMDAFKRDTTESYSNTVF